MSAWEDEEERMWQRIEQAASRGADKFYAQERKERMKKTAEHLQAATSHYTPTDRGMIKKLDGIFKGKYREQAKKEQDMSKKLHKATHEGKEIFGYILANDSDGLTVFEEHGTKALFRFKRADISMVIPYSVGIVFEARGTVYSYWAEEGEFEVGDILLKADMSGFATVVELDTKSERADKRFSGWKLNASRIG